MYYNQFNNANEFYNYYNGNIMSIVDAMQIALNEIFGQVLKIELDRESGLWIYEVQIITPEGITYNIDVDAITGNIINVELED